MGHGVVQTEAEVFWYLNLSEEQKHACEQLRTLLEGEQLLAPGYDDDFTLLRFLKARQWDITKAHSMFRHMVLWRRENKIDEMYPDFEYPELEHIKDLYPHFYHKTDKFGRPLYIELTGRMQSGKMVEHTTTQRFLDYHIFCWERFEKKLLPACSRRAGKPVITSCVIIDLNGLSMKNFTLTTKNLLTHIAKIDQDYYPEHLGQMFFINAPMVFRAIWACVNPLLEDRTRKKIQILGADYLTVLRQYIDDDNLPVMFGGNSVVEEMIGIGAGPWQEEEKAKAEEKAAAGAVAVADIKAQGVDADIIHSLAAVQQVVVAAAM